MAHAPDPLTAAFAAAPRSRFLPEGSRGSAGLDRALPIGHGQTNSQPTTVSDMLRLLGVRPGDRILDVGSGSGWTTALLARLTGPTGTITGVEVVPELVERGARNLAPLGLEWAAIRQAEPGVLGAPEGAPYDRILVSADGGRLPRDLVAQLADGGRMVLPVAGVMTLLERAATGVRTSTHGHYRFVPLV